MKQFIIPTYTFTPGVSGVGTVDLTGIVGFNKKFLLSIINQTRGVVIYSTANTTLKYTAVSGTLVTLYFDTSTHSGADVLQVVYEEKNTDIPISNGGFFPDPLGSNVGNYGSGEDANYRTDGYGNLATRGLVFTDEGSLREDFAGTTISSVVVGNMTFANGSDVVTGTNFLTQIRRAQYVKLDADADAAWAQVFSVVSDTELSLKNNYTGTSGTGASSQSVTKPIIGTGGSIAVANSLCTITSGVTTSSITGVSREIDYGPLMMFTSVSINQRVANLTSYIGLQDVVSTTPSKFARFVFSGVTNTTLTFQTASVKTGNIAGANDTETTIITLKDNTTASTLRYKIELSSEGVNAYIDDKLVARHLTHIPEPYDIVDLFIGHINGTTPSTTDLVVDMVSISNFDSLKITPSSAQDKFIAELPDLYITGASAQTVIGNNALNAITGTKGIDVANYWSALIQVISTGTGGTYVFECSNDGTNWVTQTAQNVTITAGTLVTSAITASSSIIIYTMTINAKFIRLRIATTITGGSIQCFSKFAQTTYKNTVEPVVVNSGVITTVASITSSNTATAQYNVDSSPTAVGTSTSGVFTPQNCNGFRISVPVTAITGSGVIDFWIEETPDQGTNYFKIYDFPRISAVGIYVSPVLRLDTNRIRYQSTLVSGTSVTRAVNRYAISSCPDNRIAQLIDRTIDLGTLNSVSPSILCENSFSVMLEVNVGAITTTACQIQIEGSSDNITFYSIGTPLTAIASSTVALNVPNSHCAKYMRARISTAGVGVTAGYILIKVY